MALKSFSRAFLLCISLAFVTKLAYQFYNKRNEKVPKEIHEVVMFSQSVTQMKRSKYSRVIITPSLDRILYYLNTPRHTLDICMYVFTNTDLANAVLKLHYRGVKVRIIVDADMAFSSGSSIFKLEKQRIPVRWMKSTNLMHHKFCLLDASTDNAQVTPVVMMGSLNWTNQALNGNWEDVVVTSQEILVQHYMTEFERLWTLFKPIVDV